MQIEMRGRARQAEREGEGRHTEIFACNSDWLKLHTAAATTAQKAFVGLQIALHKFIKLFYILFGNLKYLKYIFIL